MTHLMVANRYDSVRDDGRRVTMMKIACQEYRCQLPKDDSWSTAFQEVTCHECLKVMVEAFVRKASLCSWKLKNTKYVKPTGFRFPKLIRGKKDPHFEIDPEILKRIEQGI